MRKIFITLSLLFAVMMSAMAQMPEMPQLPLDPAVRYGKLENGLTYYIRHNNLPEHHVDFYIAQRVGSILEEDSQRGLAHFLEHMAFNGTKNFPGKNMINYLERNGVKFGANLNAYTSFDETVYNICDVPVTEDHPNIVDSCLLILHDWSGYLSLEDEEIDNERGVIHEEWRSRNSATMRMLENSLYPKMLSDTPYPVRMPIGTMEVVDNFKYEELRNYYKKWYRPDLQGIIVVGDVDVDYVEQKIKEFWADIQTPADAPAREYVEIADNEQTLAAAAFDKEFSQNYIEFGFKSDRMPRAMRNTQLAVINDLVENVVASAFNQRVSEAIMQGKCTILNGNLGFSSFIAAQTEDAATFSASYKENEWKTALNEIADMANTFIAFGISQSELDRVKADVLVSYENRYNEREKRKNSQLTGALISHFTDGEYALDIETEYQMVQQVLEALPLDAYNQALKSLATKNNRFIYTIAQEKEGVTYPTDAELAQALDEALAREAKPYEETVVAASFMDQLPKAGKIKKVEDTDFGFKVWTLSNGAKIVWKQTDFKNDQILISAISPVGSANLDGLSVAEKDNLSEVFSIGGFADFSATDISKMLAGKNAQANISFSRSGVNVSGSCSPKDIRTMMEMIYLGATKPRMDQGAYDSWFKRERSKMEMAEGTPNKIQSDSLTCTIYKGQKDMYPVTVAEFEQIDYKKMLDKAATLTKNAADFTFFMIGNINEDSLKVMAEQYIATLPSTGKATKKYDKGYIFMTKGNRENRFDLPMAQPMTTVYNVFCLFDKPYNMKEQVAVNFLGQIAQTTLTETIREKEGGVYSPGAGTGYGNRQEMIQMIYVFVTGEEKLAHIEEVAYREISKLAEEINDDYFQRARDYAIKNYQAQQKENSYWLSVITEKYLYGNDGVTGIEDAIKSVTHDDVKAIAKEIISNASRIQFVSNGVEKK